MTKRPTTTRRSSADVRHQRLADRHRNLRAQFGLLSEAQIELEQEFKFLLDVLKETGLQIGETGANAPGVVYNTTSRQWERRSDES